MFLVKFKKKTRKKNYSKKVHIVSTQTKKIKTKEEI